MCLVLSYYTESLLFPDCGTAMLYRCHKRPSPSAIFIAGHVGPCSGSHLLTSGSSVIVWGLTVYV